MKLSQKSTEINSCVLTPRRISLNTSMKSTTKQSHRNTHQIFQCPERKDSAGVGWCKWRWKQIPPQPNFTAIRETHTFCQGTCWCRTVKRSSQFNVIPARRTILLEWRHGSRGWPFISSHTCDLWNLGILIIRKKNCYKSKTIQNRKQCWYFLVKCGLAGGHHNAVKIFR